MATKYFELGGKLSKKENIIFGITGISILILIWYVVSAYGIITSKILPNPIDVLTSVKELYLEKSLMTNIGFSIKLNLYGYVESIFLSIIVGFTLGLFPIVRSLFSQVINAIRFIPLTAVTGIFITLMGMSVVMKYNFLGFGIFIYLLPIIVERIDTVDKIYLQTIKTLGATKWQTFKHVYIPSVLSRVAKDVLVIVAVSWTYIIVAEMINSGEGGIGSLIHLVERQSRYDMMYALLFIIIIIGVMQDTIFQAIDWLLFPFKYNSRFRLRIIIGNFFYNLIGKRLNKLILKQPTEIKTS
jgi:NitT/TauT family transport system permease protein